MPSLKTSLMTLGLAATLTACGGGGDSGGTTPPGGGGNPPPNPGPNVSLANEVLVQFKLGSDVDAVAAAFGLSKFEQFGKRPIWRLRTAAGADLSALVTALRADVRVQAADQNFETETPEGRPKDVWAVGGSATTYVSQWAPSALKLPQAHSVSQGANIRVAVLDSGIDGNHPAFAGKLLPGRDFVDDDNDPSEVGIGSDPGFGHGTHVAGLVSLAAPAARIMPLRVLTPQGKGNVWVVAEALGWAVDPDGNPNTDDGAHVINLSLGTTQQTSFLRAAVALADCEFDDDDDEFSDAGYDDDKTRCANKFGAVVLAAAGNDGSSTQLQYPAAEAAAGSLSVAASTAARTLATFSNSGSWIEIAAPGDGIISTFPGGGYATWRGTSMATPLAAGAAALVLATYADPRSVVPQDITNRLLSRSSLLCGTPLRQIDAQAAVTDTQATDQPCS